MKNVWYKSIGLECVRGNGSKCTSTRAVSGFLSNLYIMDDFLIYLHVICHWYERQHLTCSSPAFVFSLSFSPYVFLANDFNCNNWNGKCYEIVLIDQNVDIRQPHLVGFLAFLHIIAHEGHSMCFHKSERKSSSCLLASLTASSVPPSPGNADS